MGAGGAGHEGGRGDGPGRDAHVGGGGAADRPVWLLLNSDEETGSQCSRALIESLATEMRRSICAGAGAGDPWGVQDGEKGSGATTTCRSRGGRAQRGGFRPGTQRGAGAWPPDRARQRLTDLARGITVNAGVIGGGTRSNVVAAEAWAEFDVRIAKAVDARAHGAAVPFFAGGGPAMQAGDYGRIESAADGADFRDGCIISPRSNNGRGVGFPFAGSSDRRRFGREFYLGPGDSDAGWNGRGGRRRTCFPRIHSARCSRSQDSTACGDDRRPFFAVGRGKGQICWLLLM